MRCRFLLLLLLFPAVAVRAPALTLDEALRLSLRHNPEIANLDARLADKLGTALEIEAKKNPEFKITNARASEPAGRGHFFEAELENTLRPSDFGLRSTYAAALRSAAGLEQQAELLRILNETARLYYRVWALQERVGLLQGASGEARTVLDILTGQLEAGQSSQAQQSIFTAEERRFAADLAATRAELTTARIELQRATGLFSRTLRVAPVSLSPIPDTFALSAFAETRAGLRQLAEARRAAAVRAVQVARADGIYPEIAPGIIYSRNGERRESEIGFTVAGRLPIWDRNEGAVVRARGELAAAERDLAALDRVTLDRLIESRRAEALARQRRAVAFRTEVLPAYREAYQATLAQFRAGQVSALQLFEVQKSLVENQEQGFAHALDALQARLELERLIGGKIEEVTVRSPAGGK